jgi:hypothetical protein
LAFQGLSLLLSLSEESLKRLSREVALEAKFTFFKHLRIDHEIPEFGKDRFFFDEEIQEFDRAEKQTIAGIEIIQEDDVAGLLAADR